MRKISLQPIGILYCDLNNAHNAPKSTRESNEEGVIEIEPKYIAGLDGISAGSSILVLFWFDQAKRDVLHVHPKGNKNIPKRGVFATHSPMRPNPIAISKLKVLHLEGNRLTVQGIDAINNTPVLDIKSA